MHQLYLCTVIVKYALNFITCSGKSRHCQVLRTQTPNCNPHVHWYFKMLTLKKTEIANKCGEIYVF
jgi:hypothetical protein